MNDFKNTVIDFVRDCLHANMELSEESDLYEDLHLYGDDVDDFFTKFTDKFKLDITNLEICGCFADEVSSSNLFPKFGFRPSRKIRIKHLIEAAQTGIWPSFEIVNKK